MSSISLLTLTTQIYADTTTLHVRTRNNDSLLTDTELLDQSPIEDLHDQVYTLRGVHGGPVAHGPVRHVPIMWI